MKRCIALPTMLIFLPFFGISGCANPADDVAPATTLEARAIPPAPASPGPTAAADPASKPASSPALGRRVGDHA